MEDKVVRFECRSCKQKLERKEFYYKNFETTRVKKICWECEKQEAINKEVDKIKLTGRELLEDYKVLLAKYNRLQNITSIKVNVQKIKVPKYKHHSLNIYMEEGNVNEAWMLHKGQYRLYRTYPNKFLQNDSCIIYKRPDGTNKYYGLIQMHEWIMEKQENIS